MIVRLAGFEFEVGPDEMVTGLDRETLSRLTGGAAVDGAAIRNFDGAPWKVVLSTLGTRALAAASADTPTAVSVHGDTISLTHSEFTAEISPADREARLFRAEGREGSIPVVLRVALSCRLPLSEGLPLHAAAVVAEGQGIVFFGPSGAGKSTIAGLSPFPVLSDEFVVVVGRDPVEVGSGGFWGQLEGGRTPEGFVPLRALVGLEKSEDYRLSRLSPREALLRLMEVVTIPTSPPLWRATMPIVGRLIESVPVYRMAWTPARAPWHPLLEDLSRKDLGVGSTAIETPTGTV